MKILGTAKILGAIAIITGRVPKLKEWAVGFDFIFEMNVVAVAEQQSERYFEGLRADDKARPFT